MLKNLLLSAPLALALTAPLSQAASYMPIPECDPCVANNYMPIPECDPCVVNNYMPIPECDPCIAQN